MAAWRGALEGNIEQFFKQCVGVCIVVGYGALASLAILLVVKLCVGLRVPDQVEREGLDLALHGETLP